MKSYVAGYQYQLMLQSSNNIFNCSCHPIASLTEMAEPDRFLHRNVYLHLKKKHFYVPRQFQFDKGAQSSGK